MEERSKMKLMANPYSRLDGYNCFGCSPDNNDGLQMEFYTDGEIVICEWDPKPQFQGYVNVLHGGIQSTLIDEIACWLVHAKLKTSGVTSSLNVRYLKPVPSNEGKIKLTATLEQMRKNLADVKVELFSNSGIKCAEGLVTYFTFPLEYAKKKLHFPDPELFFTDIEKS
ncbi:MAG: PaaI family thioesterase [Bacteroidales bacterium]